MRNKTLLALWGSLFIICAGLGFIPEPAGLLRAGCTLAALGFFLPPAVLICRARKRKDQNLLVLLRNLSALSLGGTLVLLIANLLSATGSEFLGTVLHYTLVIFSAPMICGGPWALSLFLWACLLVLSCKKP